MCTQWRHAIVHLTEGKGQAKSEFYKSRSEQRPRAGVSTQASVQSSNWWRFQQVGIGCLRDTGTVFGDPDMREIRAVP